jgi:hypothetical protein
MAHTPGPWIVREPEEDELYELYAENGGDLICYPVYTRNQRDNIHLIAAAPELLASLRWLVSSAKMRSPVGGWAYMISDRAMDEARAAIAKAEGITTEVDDGKERSLD